MWILLIFWFIDILYSILVHSSPVHFFKFLPIPSYPIQIKSWAGSSKFILIATNGSKPTDYETLVYTNESKKLGGHPHQKKFLKLKSINSIESIQSTAIYVY